MSARIALLLEARDGNTYAVVCHSEAAADKVRAVTHLEVIGQATIITATEAILGFPTPEAPEKGGTL